MIIFKKIKWKNILSTGNVYTEFDLTKNQSTLIVGENGAGKSTILDALTFALYGKPFRNINKAQLLNSINQKNLEVIVEFDIGMKHYLVKRGIKPNIFEIYCNDQLLDQHADSKQYQEMFEKSILKLNSKSFNQIVILGSASFTPFMQLSAAVRREIIEDLLDIQIFSKMNVLLKDKISKNKENIVDSTHSQTLVEERITLNKKHLESLKQNNDQLIEERKQKLNAFNTEIKKVEELLVEQEREKNLLEEQQKANQKVLKKQNKYIDLKEQIEDKLSRVEKDITFFHANDNCPTCKQTIDSNFKKHTVEDKQHYKDELADGLAKIKIEIDQIAQQIDDEIDQKVMLATVKFRSTNTELDMKKCLAEQMEKEIQQLGQKSIQVTTSEQDITDLEVQLEQNKQQLKQLQQEKQLLDVAGFMLKDTGIKTKIIKQYVPVMNKLINKYLAAMDFFVSFEINENFEETVKSRFRDEFTYASFSEGEKMRIDLALLFTWRAIAKLRNSASTNLLIMDEVFDSSLDGAGTEEFLKILNNLTKDTNTFIISHKGDQLFDKFANVIKFEKYNNFSRITK